MLHIVDKEKSILNNFLGQLRDKQIQKDSMRFRRNIQRIGELMAYEISKTLNYRTQSVETPLGQANVDQVCDTIVLGTILRAGLPLHEGFHNFFDDAETAFVSAYRRKNSAGELEIVVEYNACPNLEGKTLILVDPMLATGGSLIASYEALVAKGGKPAHTHFASVLACTEGVDYVLANTDGEECDLWCATVDPILNTNKYIVPGLGDAGDLCYGAKL